LDFASEFPGLITRIILFISYCHNTFTSRDYLSNIFKSHLLMFLKYLWTIIALVLEKLGFLKLSFSVLWRFQIFRFLNTKLYKGEEGITSRLWELNVLEDLRIFYNLVILKQVNSHLQLIPLSVFSLGFWNQ